MEEIYTQNLSSEVIIEFDLRLRSSRAYQLVLRYPLRGCPQIANDLDSNSFSLGTHKNKGAILT